MNGQVEARPQGIGQIFHPTDFSAPSMTAFAHALKLSVGLGSELTIMHIDPTRADPDFEDFPRVRATLVQWGLLPPGASREDLLTLGLRARKIRALAEDPVMSVVQWLAHQSADLMVLATHEHDQLASWFHHPAAHMVARQSRTMTLFVPPESRGFVSLGSGDCSLRRVLIPIDHRPSPHDAVEAACLLADGLGAREISFQLLYVGSEHDRPPVSLPRRSGWAWSQVCTTGIVADEILAAAEGWSADLIVMGTQWRHGFLDALHGSTTERVLRATTIPLLAVPVL
ncbi:MAG: universal stress protein [Nitrospirota bacterium]|nr:universal stress protein [Nitrospirota bacterium]